MSIFQGDSNSAARIERRGTGFEMRTNIKARPNSQGTLFQGGKPTAEHRWPRGYAPSRMAEAVDRLGGGGVHSRIHLDVDPEENDHDFHPHFNPTSEDHTRRLITEGIARSTTPLHDLTHLNSLTLTNRRMGGTLGMHSTYGNFMGISRREITIGPHPDGPTQREALAHADSTLTHELGHHSDSLHQPDYIHTDQGRLEAQADQHMLDRFRNDPRNQRKTLFNVGDFTYGQRGAAHLAGHGYRDPALGSIDRPLKAAARRGPLSPQQFDTQGSLF